MKKSNYLDELIDKKKRTTEYLAKNDYDLINNHYEKCKTTGNLIYESDGQFCGGWCTER